MDAVGKCASRVRPVVSDRGPYPPICPPTRPDSRTWMAGHVRRSGVARAAQCARATVVCRRAPPPCGRLVAGADVKARLRGLLVTAPQARHCLVEGNIHVRLGDAVFFTGGSTRSAEPAPPRAAGCQSVLRRCSAWRSPHWPWIESIPDPPLAPPRPAAGRRHHRARRDAVAVRPFQGDVPGWCALVPTVLAKRARLSRIEA